MKDGLASILNEVQEEVKSDKLVDKKVDIAKSDNPLISEMAETLSYEQRIKTLEAERIDLLKRHEGIPERMPVSKKDINFHYDFIDPDLIDVHPKNARIQSLLTMESVSDIFEDIRVNGQLYAVTLRPKEDGRFEAIDGSRRKFCSVALDRKVMAKIGNVPDEDVETLSRAGNKSLAFSDYELGFHYLGTRDDFSSENKFFDHWAEEEGVSKSTIRTRCLIASMPDWFVNLYCRPNDIASTGIIQLQAAIKDGVKAKLLKKEAGKLRKQYLQEFKEIQEWPSHSRILKDLMGVLKEPKPSAPKAEKVNNDEGVVIYSRKVNKKGSLTIELFEGSSEQREEIEAFIQKVLG